MTEWSLVQATSGSAGYDIVGPRYNMTIPALGIKYINTDIILDLAPNTIGMIVPRSSAHKKQPCLELANVVGIIDSDYDKPLVLAIRNTGRRVIIDLSKPLFQLIVIPKAEPFCLKSGNIISLDKLRTGGFGSTDGVT